MDLTSLHRIWEEYGKSTGRVKILSRKPNRNIYTRRLEGHKSPAAPALRSKIEEVEQELRAAFPAGTPGDPDGLLEAEARASAAIEDEFDEERVGNHITTLGWLASRTLDKKTLLEAHRRLMAGQPRAQPGMYRTVNVRVGDHVAPRYEKVEELMGRLLRYIQKTPDGRTTAAAWGHAQFETIHPFADGNGRAGRALIQKQLQAPLPISIWILENRRAYYSMLGCGDWELYLEWFLGGIAEICREIPGGGWKERAAAAVRKAEANAPRRTYSL